MSTDGGLKTNSSSESSDVEFCEKGLREEVAMLRKKLREMEDDNNSNSSPRGVMDEESATITNLRKELAKVENERADMEMQFMNQMAALAFENQTTIEDFKSKLEKTERLLEERGGGGGGGGDKEMDKLRKKVEEEQKAAQKEIDNLKRKQAAADHELAENKLNLDQMHEEIVDLMETRDALADENEHFKLQMAEKDDVILAFKNRLDELQESSEENLLKLRKQVADTNASKNEELGEMNDTLIQMEELNAKLEDEIGLLNRQNQEKDELTDTLKRRVDELQKDFQGNQQKLSKTEQELKRQHEHEISDMQEDYERRMSSIRNVYEQKISVMEQKQTQQPQHQLDQHENEQIQSIKDDCQQQLQSMKEEHRQQIRTVEQEHQGEVDMIKERHQQHVQAMNEERQKQLQTVKDEREQQLQMLKEEHQQQLQTVKEEHQQQLQTVKEEHQEQLQMLNEQHQQQLQTVEEDHQQLFQTLKEEHQQQLQIVKHQHEQGVQETKDEHDLQIQTTKEQVKELVQMTKEYQQKVQKTEEEYRQQIENTEESHRQQIQRTNEEHQQQIHEVEQQHQKQMHELAQQLQTLQKDTANAQSKEMTDMSDAILDLEGTKSQLLGQVEQWRAQANEKDAVVSSLKQKLGRIENEFEQRIEHLEKEQDEALTAKNEELGEMNDTLIQLEEVKAALIEEVTTYRVQLDKEQATIASLRKSLDDLDQVREQTLNDDISRLRRNLDESQKELCSLTQTYHSDVAQLEQQIKDLKIELSNKEKTSEELEGRVNEERTRYVKLSTQMADLEQQMKLTQEENYDIEYQLEQDLEACRKELAERKHECERLKDTLDNECKTNDELRAKITSLQNELTLAKEQDQTIAIQLEGQINELTSQINTVTEKLLSAESRAQVNEGSVAKAIEDATTDIKAEVKWLQDQNKTLIEESDELQFLLNKEKESTRRLVQKYREEIEQERERNSSVNDNNNNDNSNSGQVAKRVSKPGSVQGSNGSSTQSSNGSATPQYGSRSNSPMPSGSPLVVRKANQGASASSGPRTPVRGIIESFEKRIPKGKTSSSGDSNAEADIESIDRNVIDELKQALENEKVTVAILESKMQVESDLVTQLRHELDDMDHLASINFEKLQDKLDASEKEVHRLRSKVAEYETILADIENNADERTKEIEKDLQQDRITIEDLRSQVEETTEKLCRAEEELLRFRVNMDQTNSSMTEYERKSQNDQVEIERLNSQIESLSSSRHMKSEEIECLKSEIEAISSSKKMALEETERLNSQIAVLTSSKNEALDEIERLNSQIELLSSSKDEALKEVDRLSSEIQVVSKSQNNASQEIERLNSEVASLSSAHDMSSEEQRTYLAEIERLTEQVALATSLQHDLEAKQSNLETKSRLDEAEIERLQGELSCAEKLKNDFVAKNTVEIDELNMKISEAAALIKKYEKKIEEDQGLIDSLRMQINDISMDNGNGNTTTISSMLSPKSASKDESETNNDYFEEATTLRAQVDVLQHELQDALTRAGDNKIQMERLQSERNAAVKEAEEAEQRSYRSYDAGMKDLKVELTKTQMSKADMEVNYQNRIRDLENELESMQFSVEEEMEAKRIQLDDLQLQLNRKIDEVTLLEREREQICSSMNNMSSSRKDEMEELQNELMEMSTKTASQTREIQALKMKVEEHEFRSEELGKLRARCRELESEVRRNEIQRHNSGHDGDLLNLRQENSRLRETIRNISMERQSLQHQLETIVADKNSSSKSAQVLRDRNTALRKEVEKLSKRLKKMESSMTRFTI